MGPSKEQRLSAIYSRIPNIECKGLCHEACEILKVEGLGIFDPHRDPSHDTELKKRIPFYYPYSERQELADPTTLDDNRVIHLFGLSGQKNGGSE